MFLVVDYRQRLPPHLNDALSAGQVEFWGQGLSEQAVDWIVRRVRELLDPRRRRLLLVLAGRGGNEEGGDPLIAIHT
jgi:NAD(P)H-hydrate repair Nnr-like enzyme with NAD(P)H-hydrate epimerase domain